eukprot:CAMPEP_0114600656 /NCGR_PEP_ID=MMETSP0125-20121206/23250_1 /TAXON_ID=485358 ORGANISM="Aristerostoma sp., Strain ATCC 50986" /NCGR_SAMPLE_ID=MMETSP0125 /ASSEMBLY_ACC=CAM_ASM_000245 /LENGTH=109 /DNA_ID=CAMNT_0001809053 /DNA_START=57 /DNA_END=386 /DNA_ORIENTATION=+
MKPLKASECIAFSLKRALCGAKEYKKKIPKTYLKPQSALHQGKKTLVLDLDETLIHAAEEETADYDFELIITGPLMSDMNFYIHKRPGVEEFIKQMAKQYELVVFTASQ